MNGLIGAVIIGILAGLCANRLMDRKRDGCWWNFLLGIFGGIIGRWVFDLLNISWGGLLGELGTAVVGAVLVLWVAARLKK